MREQVRFIFLCDSIPLALEGLIVTWAYQQGALPEARRRVFARRHPKLTGEAPARKKDGWREQGTALCALSL